ncbi:MAG TPA: WG repeat-containing protein [Bacteroidales bacterium]|nr:WG repeat-containing protein [Bacteroidales bacterium]
MVSNLQNIESQSLVKKEVVVVAYTDNEHYRFSDGLCAIQRNQLWGFIDTTGKFVIDFRFSSNGFEIPTFHEGKCCVSIQSSSGEITPIYIDKAGNTLFQNQVFSGITAFSNGLAIVEKTESTKSPYLSLIDSTGKPVAGAISPGYSPDMKLEFRGFSDGLAAIFDSKTNSWGFINTKGKWAILPDSKFQTVGDFHDGLAYIQNAAEGKWGAINTKGELIIPYMYDNRPLDFAEGLSAVRNQEDKVGYIDKTGNLIIPYHYEPIMNQNGLSFFEGNAIVSREGNYYSISAIGKENLKIGDASMEVRMLQNGLIAFKKWTKSEIWGIGLIRTNGEVLLEPNQLYQLEEFDNGLAHAQAKINGLNYNGFVDLEANFVILNENQ